MSRGQEQAAPTAKMRAKLVGDLVRSRRNREALEAARTFDVPIKRAAIEPAAPVTLPQALPDEHGSSTASIEPAAGPSKLPVSAATDTGGVLVGKGKASAKGFQPFYWSYGSVASSDTFPVVSEKEGEGSRSLRQVDESKATENTTGPMSVAHAVPEHAPDSLRCEATAQILPIEAPLPRQMAATQARMTFDESDRATPAQPVHVPLEVGVTRSSRASSEPLDEAAIARLLLPNNISENSEGTPSTSIGQVARTNTSAASPEHVAHPVPQAGASAEAGAMEGFDFATTDSEADAPEIELAQTEMPDASGYDDLSTYPLRSDSPRLDTSPKVEDEVRAASLSTSEPLRQNGPSDVQNELDDRARSRLATAEAEELSRSVALHQLPHQAYDPMGRTDEAVPARVEGTPALEARENAPCKLDSASIEKAELAFPTSSIAAHPGAPAVDHDAANWSGSDGLGAVIESVLSERGYGAPQRVLHTARVIVPAPGASGITSRSLLEELNITLQELHPHTEAPDRSSRLVLMTIGIISLIGTLGYGLWHSHLPIAGLVRDITRLIS